MEKKLDITHFTDPLCFWCYAMEPEIRKIRVLLDNRADYRIVMGVLSADVHELIGHDAESELRYELFRSLEKMKKEWPGFAGVSSAAAPSGTDSAKSTDGNHAAPTDIYFCRDVDGLVEKIEDLKFIKDRYPILGWPLIRGCAIFLSSMINGMQALTYSASLVPLEEQGEPDKIDQWIERHFPEDKAQKLIIAVAVVLGFALPAIFSPSRTPNE